MTFVSAGAAFTIVSRDVLRPVAWLNSLRALELQARDLSVYQSPLLALALLNRPYSPRRSGCLLPTAAM
jgi:hypothetical protein